MNKTVREWVAKAQDDFQSAGVLLRVRKSRPNDAICFHCQQCAEKLMKAVLIAGKVIPPRTHNLEELSALLRGLDPTWHWPNRELQFLSSGAVIFRYPG